VSAAAPRIVGVMLAAGAARRMGQPKQLLAIDGRPLVRHAVERALAAPIAELIVVTGAAAPAVAAALDGLAVRCVFNPDYAMGQSTSLRVGALAAPAPYDALLLLLGDQPFVDPAVITRLIDAWQAGAGAIVAPGYAGQRGTPVLFDRALVPELCAVHGDQGARGIIAADPARVAIVPIDDARAAIDIDTPEDYQRWGRT
jgi:molybdenum cofactor cytidylyltransferase